MTEQVSAAARPVERAPLINAAQWRRAFSVRENGVYYALIVLVVIIAVATTYLGRPNYLSLQNLANVLQQASLTSIIGIAMTVVLVSGNFDLSVASVAALAAAILIGMVDHIGFLPAASLAMLVAITIGVINGSIIQFVGINAFVVTLGTLTAVRGIVLIYTGGKSLYTGTAEAKDAMKAFESGLVNVSYVLLALGLLLVAWAVIKFILDRRSNRGLAPASALMTVGGLVLATIAWRSGFEVMVAKPVIYMLIFMLIVWFVMAHTNVGRRLYAVGGNPEAARLSGINVTRYKLVAFVLCSATAGFAGILFASRIQSVSAQALEGSELTAIAAAILGGTSLFGGVGSVVRTVAGALLLFTLTNGFNITNLGANFQGLIEGVVLIVAAAIYTLGGVGRSRT